jgi:hypothetical protein
MVGLGFVAYYFIYEYKWKPSHKKIIITVLLLISLMFILSYFPDNYYRYANFGVSTDYRYGYASVGWHSHPWKPETLDRLFEEFKDKNILTYDMQFLVFFEGSVSPYPLNVPQACNEKTINSILQNKEDILVIDWEGFKTDQYRRAVFCPEFFDLNFSIYREVPKSDMVDEQIGYIFKID